MSGQLVFGPTRDEIAAVERTVSVMSYDELWELRRSAKRRMRELEEESYDPVQAAENFERMKESLTGGCAETAKRIARMREYGRADWSAINMADAYARGTATREANGDTAGHA